jgi:hypothetical protein
VKSGLWRSIVGWLLVVAGAHLLALAWLGALSVHLYRLVPSTEQAASA